jgi:hypothetical protein
MTRRSVQLTVAVLCSITGLARPSLAKPAGSEPWTPERVRSLVLHAESEMEALQELNYPVGWSYNSGPVVGTCYGSPVEGLNKASIIMPRVRGVVTGKALPCYVATYLGCTVNGWIGFTERASHGPGYKPFTRSKVTIVEQSPERVVADIVEASSEEVLHGVIGEWDDAISKYIEHTDAELVPYKQVSRYTITRGADGVWRISDRKPPFEWECRLH